MVLMRSCLIISLLLSDCCAFARDLLILPDKCCFGQHKEQGMKLSLNSQGLKCTTVHANPGV